MAASSWRPQLYGAYGNPDHLKVLITLYATHVDGKKYEVHYSPREKVPFMLSNKRPFLEVEPSRYLFSANEICRYFLETSPRGNALLHPEMDNDWLGWEVTVLKPSVTSSFEGEPAPALITALRRVESRLEGTGQYLCGKESLGLVDIVVWSTLYTVLAQEAPHSAELALQFPNIARWFTALQSNSSFSHGVKQVSAAQGYGPFQAFIRGEIFMPRPSTPTPEADPPTSVDATPTVTSAEIAEAISVWHEGPGSAPSTKERVHPILPKAGERNVLITSALPYVNNVPHLGNIIGCVLSADVYARFCRLRGYNTLYLCGTDEYGTATETKALQEGISPQELCSKYKAIHEEVYEWFNIDFDYFGKTSTPQQTEITQDIFWRLHKRGFITENTLDQLFCGNCSRFLADRFVEGTCPLCGYCDARGDQCDKCGRLINAVDLKSPRCKTCSSEPHIKSSDHLFLDLSQLEQNVDRWSVKSAEEGFWSSNARVITSTWIRDGLKPRCISRDLKWGTPVPLEGYTDKVFYVWFDAPIGYISITACYTPEWRQWWKNPSEVTLCQFMAKDNVPFHTVVFPATLLGADDNYTLLNIMSATEYLNYEEGKFSKSRGVGVFGNNAQESGIPADIFRFYLLFIRPETQDTAFSWHDLMLKNNTDLLNNLGNFVNRSLMFLKNNFASTVPAMELMPDDQELIAMVTKELNAFNQSLEGLKLRDGLKYILNISRHGNGHIQAHEPWKLVRGSPEARARAATITTVCVNMCCLLSVMLQPYMPAVSRELQQQLKTPPECNVLTDCFYPFLPPGHKIGVPKPLFAKIEPERAEALRVQYAGGQNQQQQAPPLHPKQSKPTPSSTTDAHKKEEELTPEERAHLEEEVAKQALLVRELKAGGGPKEQVDQEVERLVKLKKRLGLEPANKKKGKKK